MRRSYSKFYELLWLIFHRKCVILHPWTRKSAQRHNAQMFSRIATSDRAERANLISKEYVLYSADFAIEYKGLSQAWENMWRSCAILMNKWAWRRVSSRIKKKNIMNTVSLGRRFASTLIDKLVIFVLFVFLLSFSDQEFLGQNWGHSLDWREDHTNRLNLQRPYMRGM